METQEIEYAPEVIAEAEAFLKLFKKIPDWDRFPLPEIFYAKLGVPRPKPNADLMPALMAQLNPPPSEYLGEEEREKAPGGVREIILPEVPVAVITEEKPLQIESTADVSETSSN